MHAGATPTSTCGVWHMRAPGGRPGCAAQNHNHLQGAECTGTLAGTGIGSVGIAVTSGQERSVTFQCTGRFKHTAVEGCKHITLKGNTA